MTSMMMESIALHLVVLLLLNLGLAALVHRMMHGSIAPEMTPRIGVLGLEGVVAGAGTLLHGPASDRPCAVWWLSQPYTPVGRHQGASDWVSSILLRLPNETVVEIRLPPSLVTYIGNPKLCRISKRDRSMDSAPKIGGIPAPGVKIWEEMVCVGDHIYLTGEFVGPETWVNDDPMRASGTRAVAATWTMVRRGGIHVGTARDLKFLHRVSRWRMRHLYMLFCILSGLYIFFAGFDVGLWQW